MKIKEYPEFSPLTFDMRSEAHPKLKKLNQGISENTFPNLYLFRNTYHYKIASFQDSSYVISGKKGKDKFFIITGDLQDKEIMDHLFNSHDYLKNMRANQEERIKLEQWGYCVMEDRDNFDYVYNREDLEKLAGRKYHKKRNLVNAFINNYNYEERPLNFSNIDDAFTVLEEWNDDRTINGDYKAAKEALEKMVSLELSGYMYYVDNEPAAWVLGEELAQGTMFGIHFEKALDNYKGIYQFINQAFASILPKKITLINREQDLGDPGLRQAKMTYRPSGFIRKCRVYPINTCPNPLHFPSHIHGDEA
jgi:hypothetical protein